MRFNLSNGVRISPQSVSLLVNQLSALLLLCCALLSLSVLACFLVMDVESVQPMKLYSGQISASPAAGRLSHSSPKLRRYLVVATALVLSRLESVQVSAPLPFCRPSVICRSTYWKALCMQWHHGACGVLFTRERGETLWAASSRLIEEVLANRIDKSSYLICMTLVYNAAWLMKPDEDQGTSKTSAERHLA